MKELPYSAAAERNRDPILAVLGEILPRQGQVLEIASGTGQHVAHFAAQLPGLQWLPSEPNAELRAAIAERVAQAGLDNVAAPLALDVLEPWPDLQVDAVLVANLLHISAAATLPALCTGAAKICRVGGVLHIYGPFKQHGEHTSAGNVAFDASLRGRDPSWGIRNLEDVCSSAQHSGFTFAAQREMPANNFSLTFVRSTIPALE